MPLLRAIVTVGGWTMGSRVLGFIRDILIANFLGAGASADAFFVAFKLPNFFRRLFAEGAFNAAFVPQFAHRLEADGLDTARRFAEAVLAVLLSVLLPFTLLAQMAMPQVIAVLAPGFIGAPDTFALAVELTRITFPYLMFMALVALMGGVLNSLGHFTAPAAAPIILNVILIGALISLRDVLPTPAHALAWGVAVAGIVQFLVMALACRAAEAGLWLSLPRLTPGVRRVLRLMIPGAIGAGVVQINLVIDTILASTLAPGAISYLYFADRVNQLPLGVVGIAVGIALLPLLSRQVRAGDVAGATDSQNRAIEFAMLLTVPAAAALIAIPEPITRILFERGAFQPADTVATARALVAFAAGLPAYVLIKALGPGFFAREDTATPVKVAALAVVANVAIAVTLMQFIGHVGIATATAVSSWLNAGCLAFILRRRGFLAPDEQLMHRLPRIILSSLAMALVLWGLARWLAPWLAAGAAVAVPLLAGLILAGLALYAALAQVSGAVSLKELRTALRSA